MKKVTIHEVAKKAGVSIKTVSRVLNSEPNVKPDKQEKVLQAIGVLNYRPNISARRLAAKRSFLLALLYEDPSIYTNPSANYVTNLQGGVLRATHAAGYDLLIHPCDYKKRGLVDEIRTLIEHTRVDGLILAPPLADVKRLITALEELHKPVALISPGVRKNLDIVHTNDRQISAEMTRYLASLGHKRIAFIQGHQDHRSLAKRFNGYRDGMKSCGLPILKSFVIQGDNRFESGEKCARSLLKRKNPPTAIFAANDDMAVGVVMAAHEMGIKVPEDLSVAGFDDVPLSRQVWPSLTTIRQPVLEMAERSTELLFHQIQTKKVSDPVCIDATIVIRESTAECPEKNKKTTANLTGSGCC